MVEAVFLDIDGTLMDTNYLHVEAWAQAFKEVGARPPRSRIHHEVGKGSDKLIPEFIEGEEDPERASGLHKEFYGEIQDRAPLAGGEGAHLLALGTRLRGLVRHQRRTGGTGAPHGGIGGRGQDSRGGLLGRSRRVQALPDIFALALKRAGVSPEDAVVVGDSVWDVEAAKEAGVRAAAVMTGGAFSRAELEEAGAYAVYKDCHELLEDGFPGELNPTGSSDGQSV